MKPILIPVARFKHYPDADVWLETDESAADMAALTDRIWTGSLFHDENMLQLVRVYRLDVAAGSLDDWTEQVAEEIAIMSLDRKTRPHKTLRLWLDRFGIDYFDEDSGEDD